MTPTFAEWTVSIIFMIGAGALLKEIINQIKHKNKDYIQKIILAILLLFLIYKTLTGQI